MWRLKFLHNVTPKYSCLKTHYRHEYFWKTVHVPCDKKQSINVLTWRAGGTKCATPINEPSSNHIKFTHTRSTLVLKGTEWTETYTIAVGVASKQSKKETNGNLCDWLVNNNWDIHMMTFTNNTPCRWNGGTVMAISITTQIKYNMTVNFVLHRPLFKLFSYFSCK